MQFIFLLRRILLVTGHKKHNIPRRHISCSLDNTNHQTKTSAKAVVTADQVERVFG